MSKPKIYPSVVTYKSNWKKQFKDIKRLGLKEVSVFLTGLSKRQRKRFYQRLEKSGVEYIPHVHIRHDFTEQEIQMLVDKYGVEYFTIHLFVLKKFSAWKLAKRLCVEYDPVEYKGKSLSYLTSLRKIGGFCLDITHYHLAQRYHYNKSLEIVNKLLQKHPVAINHLNGITKNISGRPMLDDMHFVHNLNKNFEHLKYTPRKLISKNIFLEVSNSIPKQLEIRDYLYKRYF